MDFDQTELLLSQAEAGAAALLDALTDEVCVVDGAGLLIAANRAWQDRAPTGRDPLAAATVGQNYLDVSWGTATGTGDAEAALLGVTAVLRKSTDQFSIEYDWTYGGQRRWFRLSATGLANQSGAVIVHREISERRKAEEALGISGGLYRPGVLFESYLPALVKNLAAALNVRHAFLTKVTDHAPPKLQLLSHWTGEGYGDLFAYDTPGTPCERVLTGRPGVFPSGVQKLFPDDHWLEIVGAESYVGAPIRDPKGNVLGHLGVIDTKPLPDPAFAETVLHVYAAQAAPELERWQLARRLADQSRLLDNTADAIIATDEDFTITYWNKAAEMTFGWTAQEVLGRDARDVLRSNLTAEERAEARSLTRESGVYRGEMVSHHRDGHEVPIEATVVAYSRPDGRPPGFIGVYRDISGRKLAEAALQQSERSTQAILEAIPDMIFRLDGDGRFLDYKPARDLAPLVPPSAFLGRLVTDVLPRDLAQANLEAIRACLRTGETQTLVYQLIEDGEPRDYEARIIPLTAGEVLAVVRSDVANPGRDVGAPRISGEGAGDRLQGLSHSPAPQENATVLIAAQDMSLTRLLRRSLLQSGHKAVTAGNAAEAVMMADTAAPDLFLLDGTLPGTTAAGLVREIRDVSLAPIIVVLSAETEDEALEALRSGADDFIRQPISPGELNARTETALRRRFRPVDQVSMRLELGDLVIEPSAHLATVGQTPVTLTPTEYRLLYELALAAGRVLTHDEILDRVWGHGYAGNHELLRTYVRSLRRKLGDDTDPPRFLQSERGVGYRLARQGLQARRD